MKKTQVSLAVLLIITVAIIGCSSPGGQPPEDPGAAESLPPGDETGEAGEDDPDAEAEQGYLTVVYSLEGDLWVSIGYNAPVQLTSGHFDTYPQLSPDGARVFFKREAAPSPAGQLRFDLWLVNIDGTGERLLLSAADLPGQIGYAMGGEEETMLDRLPQQMAWLSDNRHIAFNTLLEAGYGLLSFYDLWIIDTETAQVSRLLEDGDGGTFAYSPDGSKILVSNPTAIAVVNADGSGRRVLVSYPFVNTASEYAYTPQPVWSPDGSYGLAAVVSEEPFFDDPYLTVWRLLPGQIAEELAIVPGSNLFNTMSDRLWNSARTAFAYTDNESNLHLALLNGESLQVIANGEEFFGWSKDDRHWVYRRGGELILAGVELAAAPLAMPEGDHAYWFEMKWVSVRTFVALSGIYYEGMTLWTGTVGREPRVIIDGASSFDALWVR